MQLLLFAASVRRESLNKKLLALAAESAKALPDIKLDVADFTEFDMPLYDGDMNADIGLPGNALRFIHRMQKSDGLVIASPEYNFSVPGTLKNLIDWVSRASPQPWAGKPIFLMSASPSLVGGNRGLWATRMPLETCGAHVFPNMFSLAAAHDAFDAEHNLKDAALRERLDKSVASFIDYVNRLKK